MSASSVSYRSVGHQAPMRERMLKAASELFAQKGYHATSLADIAKGCCVQKPSLFHHFASKQALAIETIQNLESYCDEVLFKVVRNALSSPEQRIIDFATTVQSFILERSDAFLVSALAMELMDHIAAFHEPIQQYFSAWSDALADLLTPLHGGKRAQSLSVNSLSYLQGVQIMARVNRDPAMLHQVQSFFLESWRI